MGSKGGKLILKTVYNRIFQKSDMKTVRTSMNIQILPLVLLLINIGHAQMISLGPFTLLESMESARSKCVSLKPIDSGGGFGQYEADTGDKYLFKLMFDGDRIYSIMMIAENVTHADYRGVVSDFTRTLGRYPNNQYEPTDLLPIYGSVWWWHDMVTFNISYTPKMNRVILSLAPRYDN